MKFFSKICGVFQKNYVCYKCDSSTYGEKLCSKCNEYVRIVEAQRKLEIEAKEDLKRRNWIRIRDDFLDSQDGSR